MLLNSKTPLSHQLLIGLNLELLELLKINNNVDHAGLSQLLELSNHWTSLKTNNQLFYLNNQSLIVQPATETTDVTEDLWIMLSNTLLHQEFLLQLLILTKLLMEDVKDSPQFSKIKLMLMLEQDLNPNY